MTIRLLSPLVALPLILGCWQLPAPAPVFVPPHATVEIFSTAANPGPNTKPAVDPNTKAAINLVVPPVITNVDIAGVSRSEMSVETVGGASPPELIPTLEINLNVTGTPKMLAATTNPTSPTIAVVVNGVVWAAPRIITPINGSFRVTGDHRDPKFLNAITTVTGQSP